MGIEGMLNMAKLSKYFRVGFLHVDSEIKFQVQNAD